LSLISGAVEAGTTRCGEHSDYGSLTFLFQDKLGGLEVKDVNGDWIRAKPVEGTILVSELLPSY
jgi:isopenicillin N synthase-like dioxygenase